MRWPPAAGSFLQQLLHPARRGRARIGPHWMHRPQGAAMHSHTLHSHHHPTHCDSFFRCGSVMPHGQPLRPSENLRYVPVTECLLPSQVLRTSEAARWSVTSTSLGNSKIPSARVQRGVAGEVRSCSRFSLSRTTTWGCRTAATGRCACPCLAAGESGRPRRGRELGGHVRLERAIHITP